MPSQRKNNLPDVDNKIGITLAKIRKASGLTQTQLAKKTGISQQQQSHYEKGEIHISAEMVVRFANNLKVSTDEILNNVDDKKTDSPLSLRFTRRIKELDTLPEAKKKVILQVLDDMIRANS